MASICSDEIHVTSTAFELRSIAVPEPVSITLLTMGPPGSVYSPKCDAACSTAKAVDPS
jgi:hypothetical protein